MFNNELWTVTNRCLPISIMSTQLSVSVVTASFSDLAPMDSDQETMRVRFKTQPSVVRPRRRDAHVGIGSVVGASLIDGRCPLWVKSGLSSQHHSMTGLPPIADVRRPRPP